MTRDTSAAAAELGQAAEDFKEGTKRQARQVEGGLRERLSASEALVREYPAQSALIAAGIGFLIAQLPLRFVVAGLIRGILLVLRPALALYGLAKLFERARTPEPPHAEPGRSRG